jgi:hypothetical protein
MGYVLPKGLTREERLRFVLRHAWSRKLRRQAYDLLRETSCEWPACVEKPVMTASTTILNDNVLCPSPWPDGEARRLCLAHATRVATDRLLIDFMASVSSHGTDVKS